jgi:hypothetical protein
MYANLSAYTQDCIVRELVVDEFHGGLDTDLENPSKIRQ